MTDVQAARKLQLLTMRTIEQKQKKGNTGASLRQNPARPSKDARRTQPARSVQPANDDLRAQCEALLTQPERKQFRIKHPNPVLLAALKLKRIPMSVIPIKTDGSKSSPVKWAKYQSDYATTAEILEWFDRPNPFGIGIVHGILSGGGEVVDVDDPALAGAFERRLEEIAPGLLAKLIIVQTPREDANGLRGRHYYYNFSHDGFTYADKTGETGNQKLAERETCLEDISEEEARKAGARRKDDGKWYVVKTLIETRGVGGYTIAPGSPAKVHPTGKPYQLIQGAFTPEGVEAARISFDERASILEVAHSFNEYVNPKKVISIPRTAKREDGDIKPGEAYDQAPDAFRRTLAILERHGWKHHSNDKHGVLLTRPGKHSGISARLFDSGVLYVFSSNAQPFEPEQAYTPFGVLIELEYGGDASACARALSADGFGERPKTKAADSSPAILDGKIKLDVEPATHGKVRLAARDARGTVLHRDKIDLDSAKDRDAFIKALKLTNDDDAKAVQSALLAIDTKSIAPLDAAKVNAAEERVMSKILSDGRIIEQLAGQRFAVYDPASDTFTYADAVEDAGAIYKPVDLAVDMRLPENLTEYGSEAELDKRIEEIYRRYCDAPEAEMKKAIKYVRLTYAVDLLNVLPYLKATGEGGSGKSRFCRVGVKMSYHPVEVVDITKAVLFRLVDECKPTLFIDEFNPDTGGEDTEGIIQVLNAGFQRGANVYRTEEPDANGKRKVGSYSPFGAKFLAGLKSTGSAPFESRCVEVKLQKTTRKDIRFRDTPKMDQECAAVAEMLYLWRLRFLSKSRDDFETLLDKAEDDLKEHDVDPRFIQISTPLYALIEDEGLKRDFIDSLEKRTMTTRAEKLDTVDGKIVRAIYDVIYDNNGDKVNQRRPFEVNEPIYDATIADIRDRLSADYPDLKDNYVSKKLSELGFSKARLTKRSYSGKPNEKRERNAVVFEPETLAKIFTSYGLFLPGEPSAPVQPNLVEIEDQTPWNLEEHPEPERVKKGR